MNMRTFAVVFGAIAAASLAAANFTACVITGSGGSGGGGIGGEGGGMASSSSSSSTSTSTSTSSSSGMDGGMCDMTLHCAGAITPPGDPTKVCAGSDSETKYKAYHDCACTTCKTDCGDNSVCVMPIKDASAACNTCLTSMCPMAVTDCTNDQ